MGLHLHTEECRVPLETLFAPIPVGSQNNTSYYYRTATDGTIYVRLNRMYALEGCAFMRIPIFLPGKPANLTEVE